MLNHAETGHLDTPKERALRLDYEAADWEVQYLKRKISRLRVLPISAEATAMFYYAGRCEQAEKLLRQYRVPFTPPPEPPEVQQLFPRRIGT